MSRAAAPAVGDLSDGQLADEHRGLELGIWRYKQRKEAVEAELVSRGRSSYEGDRAPERLCCHRRRAGGSTSAI